MHSFFHHINRVWLTTANSLFISSRFNYTIICVGILLRINHYFQNRSLWLDEAWVAVSTAGRTAAEIITNVPFAFDIATPPIVFSLIEKGAVTLLGYNEFALRLFPLLAGIGALFVFYKVCQCYLPRVIIPCALALFVCCDALIYYAAELKQYSSDVLAVLLLYWFLEYAGAKIGELPAPIRDASLVPSKSANVLAS